MSNNKAWVIAVNMGYGHQRTAHPLRKLAPDSKVINANSYEGIPEKDKNVWETTRSFYEFISNFNKVPLVGRLAFSIFDKFQQIPNFYPKRNLSKPTFFLKKMYSYIEDGWGKDLIYRLRDSNPNLPLITTFFIPAFMAEELKYPGDIFCVICDADIARPWAPLNPSKSRIKYFAPNEWVVNRLKLYGVREKNIILSGYPLPTENIGTKRMEVLKKDLKSRLFNLDPRKDYYKRYGFLIEKNLGLLPKKSVRPLTILFSIGGAGAQKEIVIEFIKSLTDKIKEEKIKIILSAGVKKEVRDYFLEKIGNLGLKQFLNGNDPIRGKKVLARTQSPQTSNGVQIIFEKNIESYFNKFNQKLRETDILWTKPSELSFYSGLGLPIIIAPTIGSQENFNRKWLLRLRAGFLQDNPRYADQWFFDYLNSGRFAEAAMQGFLEVEKLGVYKISETIFK